MTQRCGLRALIKNGGGCLVAGVTNGGVVARGVAEDGTSAVHLQFPCLLCAALYALGHDCMSCMSVAMGPNGPSA